MEKKIDSLAKEYSEYIVPLEEYVDNKEEYKIEKMIQYDDAKPVIEWIFSKNIIHRMTEDEITQIKNLYKQMLIHYLETPDVYDYGLRNAMSSLQNIFGKDFFKEK